MKKFSLNIASLVILAAVIACSEPWLIRRVEAKGETCSLTSECMLNNTCGTDYLVICRSGICTCEHRIAGRRGLKQQVDEISKAECKKDSDCQPVCGCCSIAFCQEHGKCFCLFDKTSSTDSPNPATFKTQPPNLVH